MSRHPDRQTTADDGRRSRRDSGKCRTGGTDCRTRCSLRNDSKQDATQAKLNARGGKYESEVEKKGRRADGGGRAGGLEGEER